MTRPNWLPPCPEGWEPVTLRNGVSVSWQRKGDQEIDARGRRQCIIDHGDGGVVFVGPSCEADVGGVTDIGACLALLRVVGLTEWLPPPTPTPGLWWYTDGLGRNVARICTDGDSLVAQVMGTAGAVPVAEMDVEWLGPVEGES